MNQVSLSIYSLENFAKFKNFSEKFLKEHGLYNKNNNVVIPYFKSIAGKENNNPLFAKERISLKENPKYIFSSEPKYFSENLIPYGTCYLQNWIDNKHTDLFIVEGETDTLSAWYYGYACIGISGASSLTTSLSNHDISSLINQFLNIYLLIENDQGGKTFINEVYQHGIMVMPVLVYLVLQA